MQFRNGRLPNSPLRKPIHASIGFLETLKKPPLSGRAEQGRETPKPDLKKAAQAKRGGGKGETFSGKRRKVESRGKAGKTRRRQTRHLSIFRASKICFSLAASLSISKT